MLMGDLVENTHERMKILKSLNQSLISIQDNKVTWMDHISTKNTSECAASVKPSCSYTYYDSSQMPQMTSVKQALPHRNKKLLQNAELLVIPKFVLFVHIDGFDIIVWYESCTGIPSSQKAHCPQLSQLN